LIDQPVAQDIDHGIAMDLQRHAKELERVLQQLPPNAHACFVLHCREGWTLEEIGTRLGVSRSMVKKHIAKAVLHCRQHVKWTE
jgi:RNA polymerase sigma-70 factor (ECF subfamily)